MGDGRGPVGGAGLDAVRAFGLWVGWREETGDCAMRGEGDRANSPRGGYGVETPGDVIGGVRGGAGRTGFAVTGWGAIKGGGVRGGGEGLLYGGA